tara:strand:- start:1618 stop:2415 length:798 start_codon:yes stop_codon:yes gene_type:complete
MKTVILCGGLGTRLAEETQIKPKPMVEIGGKPILWHVMKIYDQAGFNDFILPLGYKGEQIKAYFLNYHMLSSDCSVNTRDGRVQSMRQSQEQWQVHMMDTGAETLTGGRLKRCESHLRPHGTFMLTYGDGVANIDVKAVVDFHRQHGKIATMTTVRPPARFGTMRFNGKQVIEFTEKSQTDSGWINGGFFVFEPEIFDYLHDDQTILERTPLEQLALKGQLMAFQHEGFWQCMDTMRDKLMLEARFKNQQADWLKINDKVADAIV